MDVVDKNYYKFSILKFVYFVGFFYEYTTVKLGNNFNSLLESKLAKLSLHFVNILKEKKFPMHSMLNLALKNYFLVHPFIT